MGNVQSEATPESESVKDGVEKTNPETNRSEQELSRSKHDLGSRLAGPPVPEHKGVNQTLSSEPGPGDRHSGAAEMGKNHSKKSKLKLSSMWTQNPVSGGLKEASLCDKELGAEKWGLASLSRADLPSGLGIPEDPKSLKVMLRPSPAAAPYPEPQDLSAKKTPTRGKAKAENIQLAKSAGGMLLQPGKVTEVSQGGDPPKAVVETQVSWTQRITTSGTEGAENEEQQPEPPPASAKKPLGAATPSVELLKTAEDNQGGPGCRPLNEKNIFRSAPSGCLAPSGAKKVPPSWGAGQKEKEQSRSSDGGPGSDSDLRGPAVIGQLPTEWLSPSTNPLEKLQAPESQAKTEVNVEAPEAVNYESIYQEFLDKGVNLFYRVTIQPGQWPPSIVKQKPSVISSGISYADVLKQCPQKKPPASPAPALPKTLQHLPAGAGKRLPSFKGPERSNPDEFSPLRQLFLEHIKKVTPKESAPATPTQQVVTFWEELSAGNPKRAEWQRPRPPTPYPQRRKGQGKKLSKFGTAVSQVVAFLSSDPKYDWLVQDESEVRLDEVLAAGEEEAGANCTDLPGPGGSGAEGEGASQPVTALLLDQAVVAEIHGSPQRSCRKPQAPDEGSKERSPVKGLSAGAVQHAASPPGHEPPPGQLLVSSQLSSQETLEVVRPNSSIYLWAPACALLEPAAEPKAPVGGPPTRPKARKPNPAAPKSKEKLKPPGQQKGKLLKGKGAKQWPRPFGMNSQLRLDALPAFPPFEKVARPFYFGEPSDRSLSLDKPASLEADVSSSQPTADRDPEADRSRVHHWPPFRVSNSCPRRCYCKHQEQRKLPKNVLAWLNPSANHLTEPPWVATAMLAVSLVAGTKFCLDSYKQQHLANED